jgi:hypothetical protein
MIPDQTTPQGRIMIAQRIDAFCKDDIIAGVLQRLEKENYESLLRAESSEDRVRVWAKAVVIKAFKDDLRALISAGERDVIDLAKDVQKQQKK